MGGKTGDVFKKIGDTKGTFHAKMGSIKDRNGTIAQSCPTLCDLMDYSTAGFPVHHQILSLLKLMSIESVMPSNHLILCRPLLHLPLIFTNIRVFSNESVLRIRWPKYAFGIFQLKTQKSSLCVHSDFPAITMLCRLESG